MFWWWERLDQRNFYPNYRTVSGFIADIPWNSGEIKAAEASCSEDDVRVIGLRTTQSAWLWLFNRDASWNKSVVEGRAPTAVTTAELHIEGVGSGQFEIQWINSWTGELIDTVQVNHKSGELLKLRVPAFERDIAVRLKLGGGQPR